MPVDNHSHKVAEKLADAEKILMEKYGLRRFSEEGDLLLLPKKLLCHIPQGFELTDITGDISIVGKDSVDDDTRAGLLAYGVVSGQFLALLSLLESAHEPDGSSAS